MIAVTITAMVFLRNPH